MTGSTLLYRLIVLRSDFMLFAYRRVLSVWSAEEDPGLMHAIITILELLPKKESLSTIVSLEDLNGTWLLLVSKALMHSFNASKLLLISAPSSCYCLLLFYVSAARSDPAKSTRSSLP